MNEPYFRDYHLLLDEQPDVGATARLAEHTEAAGASTRKNLPLETMTTLVVPASGEPCTNQGPIFGELPAGTVLQVRHRNRPCPSMEISIGAPP
jgi:hypothetical protein